MHNPTTPGPPGPARAHYDAMVRSAVERKSGAPLTIKQLDADHDPRRIRIELSNDAGDVVHLRCYDHHFCNTLTTQLMGALEYFVVRSKGDK